MKRVLPVLVSLFLLLVSSVVFADLYKSYGVLAAVSGRVAQGNAQLFPTVAVYNACKNKAVGEFDQDFAEDRVEPGKCSLTYPKYCNAYRMGMMEDCVKCKHLPCPAGTYCDAKRRQCKRGVAPPQKAAKPKPVPTSFKKQVAPKPKLPRK